MAESMSNNLSLVLSGLLDSYGLDENNRRRRIDCQKIVQLLWSWELESVKCTGSALLSGSSYETTTIDGLSSDVDVMFIPHSYRVIDNIEQWRPNTSMLTYMMDNTGCSKGFVTLYLLSPRHPEPVYRHNLRALPENHIVSQDGKIVLCNTALDTNLVQGGMSYPIEVHGPALTYRGSKNTMEVDNVFTLKSESFPQVAAWWKNRQSTNTALL